MVLNMVETGMREYLLRYLQWEESSGFSPFELVFGWTVCGPLKVLKEAWLGQDESIDPLEYAVIYAREY